MRQTDKECVMDDVKPKSFDERQPAGGDVPPGSPMAGLNEKVKKAKRGNRKFIDLQKQPRKPKPLIRE
jgi:hypothetical protein